MCTSSRSVILMFSWNSSISFLSIEFYQVAMWRLQHSLLLICPNSLISSSYFLTRCAISCCFRAAFETYSFAFSTCCSSRWFYALRAVYVFRNSSCARFMFRMYSFMYMDNYRYFFSQWVSLLYSPFLLSLFSNFSISCKFLDSASHSRPIASLFFLRASLVVASSCSRPYIRWLQTNSSFLHFSLSSSSSRRSSITSAGLMILRSLQISQYLSFRVLSLCDRSCRQNENSRWDCTSDYSSVLCSWACCWYECPGFSPTSTDRWVFRLWIVFIIKLTEFYIYITHPPTSPIYSFSPIILLPCHYQHVPAAKQNQSKPQKNYSSGVPRALLKPQQQPELQKETGSQHQTLVYWHEETRTH